MSADSQLLDDDLVRKLGELSDRLDGLRVYL